MNHELLFKHSAFQHELSNPNLKAPYLFNYFRFFVRNQAENTRFIDIFSFIRHNFSVWNFPALVLCFLVMAMTNKDRLIKWRWLALCSSQGTEHDELSSFLEQFRFPLLFAEGGNVKLHHLISKNKHKSKWK